MKMYYLKNVTTLNLDHDKCIGCGQCVNVCPHAVFSMEQKRARIIDRQACMECGGCAKNCPAEAITVRTGVGCAGHVIFSFFEKVWNTIPVKKET